MNAFKHIFAALIAAASLISCEVSGVIDPTAANDDGSPVFTASFEDTRVFLDLEMHTCFNADDRISLFKSSVNEQYRFEGHTGDRSGMFSKAPEDSSVPGSPASATYAVYPFNPANTLSPSELLYFELPQVQAYAEGSFAPGSNTMIAVTEGPSDKFLQFKNLCGVLVVKLYGTGKVKSLTLRGNDGEKIAGSASANAVYGKEPFLIVSSSALGSITVDCGDGVQLGSDADNATGFWFVIPPVEFPKGFTVQVQGEGQNQAVLTTSASRTIARNEVVTMTPAKADFIVPAGNVVFDDPSFKSYCVREFDKDGDGEVSYAEAYLADSIKVSRKSIASMKGLEAFVNVRYLDCSRNRLTELSVAKLPRLKELYCNSNLISELDLSGNLRLEILQCGSNQLATLSLFKNTALKEINCDINQLTRLDVVSCKALTKLECRYNKIATLNISGNTLLQTVKCEHNELTGLTMLNNTSLVSLDCSDNQLAALPLAFTTALKDLICNNNQMINLDVSRCTSLTRLECKDNQLKLLTLGSLSGLGTLYCGGNQLTSLDVSGLPHLTILSCANNPELATIWLKTGQKITSLTCDEGVTINYK
ncbi:MAG: leucine-rich repeat domain-containing protein [Bacteroidales bacterium]|nr:leucine-rich repeat domain-containing protein [Bacteroidales bacterium]